MTKKQQEPSLSVEVQHDGMLKGCVALVEAPKPGMIVAWVKDDRLYIQGGAWSMALEPVRRLLDAAKKQR